MPIPPKPKLERVSPSITGSRGVAYNCLSKDFNLRVLCSWYVISGYYSDTWRAYFVMVHHMRKVKGEKENIIKVAGLSHGVSVFRVDHTVPIVVHEKPNVIIPQTFYGMWYAASDQIAINEGLEAVKEICNGDLDPNAEEHDDWVMHFGSSGSELDNLNLSYILRKKEIH
jgi:hypothetical protein